ncbi:hypothetical protein G7Z17_g4167 [Cylindrodendrum hubeiense]|uniref:N-acetyltransferase domain-containing protein n=1 Tax=Cylindrodendrum hubeiense TaxID=595255 RepID=A0A9P5HFD5_9HYPO|nr:hypothetical protein G7Z17_g4167 [Cylindrodendrum hubeiense]
MLSPVDIPERLLLVEPPEDVLRRFCKEAQSMWFITEVRKALLSRHLIDVRTPSLNSRGRKICSSVPLSATALAANIIAYGAGVIWITGGIMNRQQGHEMTLRVLELRQKQMTYFINELHHTEDENLLANGYNDWAVQLINEGRYQDAKPYSEKSLEMKYRLLDSETNQFQFFISKILLAFILLSEGRPRIALEMALDAIQHIQKEKGPDHSFTLNYVFYVANVWAAVGDHREALGLYESSVEARTKLFGQSNQSTLNSHFAVALCLYHLGEYAQARNHVDQCLKQKDAANWGEEHVLRAKYLQALVMQRLDDTNQNWEKQENESIIYRNRLLVKYGGGKWAYPGFDPDSLCLREATEEEKVQSWRNNSAAWKGKLTIEEYVGQQAINGNQELTRNGRIRYWIYTDGATIYTSAETLQKPVVVRSTDGKATTEWSYGVAGVFTPVEFRRHGCASSMMRKLALWLDSDEAPCQFTVLWSAVEVIRRVFDVI